MTLRLQGSTSGYSEIDAPAVAGNQVFTLPGTGGTLLANESSNPVKIDSSGNVGIGTASPRSLLSFGVANASGTNGINLYDNGGNYRAGIGATSSYLRLYTPSDGSLQLGRLNVADGSTFLEAARIDNSGRLLVGTTLTSGIASIGSFHRLATSQASTWSLIAESSSATPNGIVSYYSNASPNGAGNEFLWCADSTTLRAAIRSNGGLANFQANNVNLSDRNSKKDISPAAGTWDCIKEWEIVNYRYKDQPDDAGLNLGVIAQQVAESCPEVITVFEKAKDDQPEKLGVKEQQMYWMAIKALQEAMERIENLEAANADLAARITALEAQP